MSGCSGGGAVHDSQGLTLSSLIIIVDRSGRRGEFNGYTTYECRPFASNERFRDRMIDIRGYGPSGMAQTSSNGRNNG